ncbi:hypothetical protein A3D77_05115 [Candidatus Gottesmanbacteria bacterium RIFCSPHIGHO2_02_FULL_39_11]|uniref:Uncharacterized protein n=1 Tax=Candidatus Gottesmanbacteria bacterium RIFCSPHIGHO2_02_FULL_39_11 TaxID=1798382 RepID=A0A1F5ZM85_9BACT|nr:MAG: hypothetical protein A3D77_05115 [Candidatus Gottesmanbacteria bacterium RIFCSPHIGHO2_02_FULL_39_11]
MNWVTTNIRFPEDQYMELKMEAARLRKSVSEIIRQKVSYRPKRTAKENKKFITEMNAFAKKMAKLTKGKSISKALIEMRYEQ